MKKAIIILAFLSVQSVYATVLIAGSSGESPLPFWENSFWQITPSLDRAFPFTLELEGQYNLDSLEVAVFHYEGMGGSTATFTIRPDSDGVPGDSIIETFDVLNISITEQILTADASEQALLSSGTTYWIVGETSQGNVHWNLADSVFGPYAYRVGDDDWVYNDNGNVSAFAIHGTAVPEPATLFLLGLGAFVLRRRE